MAEKLILVPERMYKGIVQQASLKNINLTSEKMGEAKQLSDAIEVIKRARRKGKRKNVSTRNILYNQALNQYLKLKRGIEEKPLRLELIGNQPTVTNTPNVLAKMLVKREASTKATPIKTPVKAALLDEEGEMLEIKQQPTTSSYNSQEPLYPLRSREAKTAVKSDKNEKLQIVMNYIARNPEKFGVTKDNELISETTGKPMAKSNVEMSIRRIVAPELGSISPNGTLTLRSRMKQDDFLKQVIFDNSGRPKQEGWGNKKKRKSCNNKKIKLKRCKKWKKRKRQFNVMHIKPKKATIRKKKFKNINKNKHYFDRSLFRPKLWRRN